MRSSFSRTTRFLAGLGLALCLHTDRARGDEPAWKDLSSLSAWKEPRGAWQVVASVVPDTSNPKLLTSQPGEGVLVNGPTGRTINLFSKEDFGDVEAHLEFLVPKGSNSGIKFEGLYEIQIADSFGVKTPAASDCGGIYPRAELLPRYRHIDDGYPPRINASRPFGEWQTLDVTFRSPRFDESGKKVANARFEKVILNGQVIHDGVEVPTPTGHVWRRKEPPTGPLLLQADHGPVAFRNIRVRPAATTPRAKE